MDHKEVLILLLWLALQTSLGSIVGRFIKIGSGEASVAKSLHFTSQVTPRLMEQRARRV
jgi:hypothetical protein